MMHWNDVEDIVDALEESYGDEEIPENDLSYLKDMVLSLAEFEDYEVEVDNQRLKQIMEHWLERRS